VGSERRELREHDGTGEAVALKVDDLVFVGNPISPDASTVETGNGADQASRALKRIGLLVEQAGGTRHDILDVVSFHADSREIKPTLEAARDFFESDFPAWTPVAASALPIPGQRVALNAIAKLGDEPRQCIVPDTIAWWRDYPISAGCKKGDLLFVAGQYGSDADGNVNTPGDHAGQARNALNRIKEICELAGGGLEDVIDLTSFHQDPRWIEAVVEMCEDEFLDAATGPEYPAWTTVGTPGLLKHGMLGQYRAIAELAGGDRVGSTPAELGWGERNVAGAAKKTGGRLIGATGVVPSSPDGKAVERGDAEAQARHCFEQLRDTLVGLGASIGEVTNVSSYHLDAHSMDTALRVAGDYFPADSPPAWTAAGMTGFWREGQLHCIQALAVS
jgi:enamine deaminase RidA (YjgF/YER057c/UK114 family)